MVTNSAPTAADQHDSLPGSPKTMQPIGFPLFLAGLVLLLALLHPALHHLSAQWPIAWALPVLCTLLAYRLAETLLALFVILLPAGLAIAAVVGFLK